MNIQVFQFINSLAGQNIWLDRFMVFSADWLGYVLVVGLILCYLKNRSQYRDMLLISLSSAILSRFGFVSLIRIFYYHPRPFLVLQNVHQLINHEIESSFPSGHAAFYFALAVGVYFYNKKAGLVYLVSAGLMGFARIFVGVHWPLDIMAGAVLGVASALMIQWLGSKYLECKPRAL